MTLIFCTCSFILPLLILRASPRIEVDSEIIRELILFVKESITTILANISSIDNLIASLPSDSSPTTPFLSGVDEKLDVSLTNLRIGFEMFVHAGWSFFADITFEITEPHNSSFQTIILDDPSFPDLIINSLQLNHKDIRENTVSAISNIVHSFPSMKDNFISVDLLGRIFETVDFVSLSLSESKPVFQLTIFLANMLFPNGDDEDAKFEQYRLIRVSVFEPAKQFIEFMFHNSDRLIVNEARQQALEIQLAIIHNHIKNMELRSDEHEANFVSEIAKWEVRTMVETESKIAFNFFFENLLNRTYEWRWNQPDRQKRREVRLREEGWDDAFELRVVGMEVDTNRNVQTVVRRFRINCTSSDRTPLASLSLIPSSLLFSPHREETGSVVIGVGGVSMSEHGEMRRNDRRVILVGIVGLEWTESSDDLAETD
ncbi:hypothetical protein BLNAU_3965 [Blattamonas nauphoetae]|uniref:Uncharacterized protein n=1 Tax=Blattamonas nauphoetae TaxID=2049346 RepID=A0ABQ9YBQ0_9EUKA|nr:hypothetical protein BLNAU_3965 [Blattamonas nauphoetae]